MIKFTDMSKNALNLSRCANRILPVDDYYKFSNHIKQLIEFTNDVYDDINLINSAKSDFLHYISSASSNNHIGGFRIEELDDYELDAENIYSYMVCLIRFANFLNIMICDSNQEIMHEFSNEAASIRLAWEIAGSHIKNKICFDSKIAEIYYTINNYDAILQYEYYSGVYDSVVLRDYTRMLRDIYDILTCSDRSKFLLDSETSKNLMNDDFYNASQNIDALNKITEAIKKMAIGIRKSLDKDDGTSAVKIIRKHVDGIRTEIYNVIMFSKMNECSYFKYYISEYVNFDASNSDADYSNRARKDEFISKISRIAEGYGNLSEFDKACLNAILSFKTYTNVYDSYADDENYDAAISELRKLLIADSIEDVIGINSNINNLLPTEIANRAISIGVDQSDYEGDDSEYTQEKKTENFNLYPMYISVNTATDTVNKLRNAVNALDRLIKKAKADRNNKMTEREKRFLESPHFCTAEPAVNEGEDLERLTVHEDHNDDNYKRSERKRDFLRSHDSCSTEPAVNKEEFTEKCNKEISEPISWYEYFMRLAETAAMRSKDPKSKVGACIVDLKDNRIVSLGYNGFPYGCSDDDFPWTKDGDDNKYLYVVHAELNAIISAKRDLTGCALFVTYSPCNECMKAIIQSGIKMVVFKEEYKQGSTINIASAKMAKAAGVDLIRYDRLLEANKNVSDMLDNFKQMYTKK